MVQYYEVSSIIEKLKINNIEEMEHEFLKRNCKDDKGNAGNFIGRDRDGNII